ncbi:MAG TPA: hypothetical protein VGC72_03105 [Candidatus Elarobacter sp.]|jgi:hypothetical protein
MRGLRTAWTAGMVFAVLIPLAAFAWQQLDRRPAWVVSVVAKAESKDEARALRDERRMIDGAVRRIGRRRDVSVEVRAERQRLIGNDGTVYVERAIVLRSATEAPLRAVARDVAGVLNAPRGEPRRATHIGDWTLAFALVAMLLALATLERSGLSDADPFAMDAPLVALDLLGLGFLAAGAVVVEHAWSQPLIPFVAVAFAPVAIWFARARTRWMREPVLRPRYALMCWLAGIVAAAWLARWLGA